MSGPDSKADWRRLRDLAEEKRDACTRALGGAIAAAQEAERKLQMLLDYQREYGQRMAHAGAGGIAAERLQNYRRFLAQLARAVEQQRSVVASTQGEVQRLQLALSVAQRSFESFQVLVERHDTAASIAQRREQQKQQDEYAARLLPRFITGAD